MGMRPPEILIMKFISDLSVEGIERAETELEAFLRPGIPIFSLNNFFRLSDWPRATFNDLLEGGTALEIPTTPNGKVIFSYFGTRQSLAGPFLFSHVSLQEKEHLSLRACDLPFIARMLASDSSWTGIVIVGQTSADLRSFGGISGRKSDVFAFALGVVSGLVRGFIRPGDEGNSTVFPAATFAGIARSAFESDSVVRIPRWGFGRFLRKCFHEISGVISRSEFEKEFGGAGVKWRPRSIFSWK